ncbi:MAG: hypothetical protein WCI27_09095 [Candidatus Omnitrophota bacterium]
MDNKTKLQLAAIGVMGIILLFAINNARLSIVKAGALKGKAVPAEPLKKDAGLQPVDAAVPDLAQKFNKTVIYKKLLELDQDLSLKRDPFSYGMIRNRVPAPVSSTGVGLTAILWSDADPLAVVDHKVVKKGDKAGQNTVVAIKEHSIILNDGVKDFELKLKK